MTTWCMDAPIIEEILPQFLEFCRDAVMVAHNASFDMSFIEENCRRLGLDAREFTGCGYGEPWPDSCCRHLNRFKLDTVAKALGRLAGKSSPGGG